MTVKLLNTQYGMSIILKAYTIDIYSMLMMSVPVAHIDLPSPPHTPWHLEPVIVIIIIN